MGCSGTSSGRIAGTSFADSKAAEIGMGCTVSMFESWYLAPQRPSPHPVQQRPNDCSHEIGKHFRQRCLNHQYSTALNALCVPSIYCVSSSHPIRSAGRRRISPSSQAASHSVPEFAYQCRTSCSSFSRICSPPPDLIAILSDAIYGELCAGNLPPLDAFTVRRPVCLAWIAHSNTPIIYNWPHRFRLHDSMSCMTTPLSEVLAKLTCLYATC